MSKMMKQLALICVLLFVVAAVSAAPVWQDEFTGAVGTAIDTGATGWNGGSGNAFLTGNGTVQIKQDWTEWTRQAYAVSTIHTFEIAFRFPTYTGTADFSNIISNINQPVVIEPQSDNAGLRFEIYQATANHHRLQWYSGGTSSREAQFPISSYYAGDWATAWQVAQFVIGPNMQAFYMNGKLVHFTRYDLSTLGKSVNVGLKGGKDLWPIEYDYVRIYDGDVSAKPVTDNMVMFDGFDQTGPKTPSDGMRSNEETWEDENAQKPNGLGQNVLNSGSTLNWRHTDGGRPFSLTYAIAPVSSTASTLEVYLRCPQGTDLGEDNYVGIRGSGGQRLELYFRGGGWRPFVHDGTNETVGTSDIRSLFVGDPTVDFQRVDIVFNPTEQKFYVNGQLAETFTVPMAGTANVWPWLKGNGPAKTVEVDSICLFNDIQVPVELSGFSAE